MAYRRGLSDSNLAPEIVSGCAALDPATAIAAGYSPQEYASCLQAQAEAKALGGQVSSTNSVGPLQPPAQNEITFSSGPYAGLNANAALAAMFTPQQLAQQAAIEQNPSLVNWGINPTPIVPTATAVVTPPANPLNPPAATAQQPKGNVPAPVASPTTPWLPTTTATTGNWFTDSMFSGIPNWGLLAAGAGLLYLAGKNWLKT